MQYLTPEKLIIQTNYVTQQLEALTPHQRMSPITNREYNIQTQLIEKIRFITCDLYVNDQLIKLIISLEKYPRFAPKIYIYDYYGNGLMLLNTIDNIRYYLHLLQHNDIELLPYEISINRYNSGQYVVRKEYRNGWLIWDRTIDILEIIHTMDYLLNFTELDTINKDTQLYFNTNMIPPEIREILLDNYNCTICMEPLLSRDSENPSNNENGYIYELHCGQPGEPHVFHLNCLYNWTLKNPICPRCRRPTKFYRDILVFYDMFNTRNSNGRNFFRDDNIARVGGSKKIKKNIKIKKSIKRNIRNIRKSRKYA
jgi:hypothetical protein